jgi:UDP-N-acetylmuramoyl-L-alanyl-D-glutamate--2,6-diaminopimelate ligase
VAVVNADDPAAFHVSEAAAIGGLAVRRFSVHPGARDVDTRVEEIVTRADGLTLALALAPNAAELRVRLPLLGRFNASNAAGAVTAALALGVDPATVARGLESMRGVPGRLERVAGASDFAVVVDYAHTPDALERALAAVREHARGRVILVFGCGGDRDRGKRPAMGAKAARGADLVWVTNDNPRSEDPARIAAEIVAGMSGGAVPTVELDRRAAIAAAIGAARPGDAVLIAGKGHETTQTIGDRVLPFDDRMVAAEILRGGART